MAIQNHLTALRLDDATDAILKGLVGDLKFNKSQVLRNSIRLMRELLEFKKEHGQIALITSKGEKINILLI